MRDVYAIGDDKLLMIATDRISAFDCVLGSPIPDKGRVLTQLSLFWFDYLSDIVPNHLITADVSEYPAELQPFRDQLEGRSMLVKRAEMVAIECVARGYLSGSGWKEYKADGSVCGIKLPAGLRESDKLPQPVFTPATKATTGHDENVSFEVAAQAAGLDVVTRLRDLTLAIYSKASEYAATRGIILADTKFEFGFIGETLILGDEVLTPDSFALLARPTSTSPAARSPPSISSLCATIWKRSPGTSSRRPRCYRPTWWKTPAASTAKPTRS